jgi:hypothetical protein
VKNGTHVDRIPQKELAMLYVRKSVPIDENEKVLVVEFF